MTIMTMPPPMPALMVPNPRRLGDGVEVVQRHYAHLLPKDDDIEKAFS